MSKWIVSWCNLYHWKLAPYNPSTLNREEIILATLNYLNYYWIQYYNYLYCSPINMMYCSLLHLLYIHIITHIGSIYWHIVLYHSGGRSSVIKSCLIWFILEEVINMITPIIIIYLSWSKHYNAFQIITYEKYCILVVVIALRG